MRITIAILLFTLSVSADAQQLSSTIILSCNGASKSATTAASEPSTDPIKDLGIIVNVADRTVAFMDHTVPVTSVSTTSVSFLGQQTPPTLIPGVKPKPFTIDGVIDRVTGYALINWWYENVGNNSTWELTCRPAKRLF